MTKNLTQNIILGRDLLQQNKVILNYKNETLTLNGCAIPLENENYINSLIRLEHDKIILPQTCMLCWGNSKYTNVLIEHYTQLQALTQGS